VDGVLGGVYWVLGLAPLAMCILWLVRTRLVRRSRRNKDVIGDVRYVEALTTLSEASVRRYFNPYTDIDWDAPSFSIVKTDPRWILSATDPVGRNKWYRSQPAETQCAIGMWRQANLAKVSLHLESILIRGLLQYSSSLPNTSPEYRYCLHEAIEECNHSLMFQELVNRIGVDVAGMPRWLRWMSNLIPLAAGPWPNVFFFGVLAGEQPIDHLQKSVLREGRSLHPAVEEVMAAHVAEEARHIAFADLFLRKHVPTMPRFSRFALSLYVPILMRVLGQAIVVPPRSFFREFNIPRSLRRNWFFKRDDSGQTMRNVYADIRMLCRDLNMMSPVAVLMWRLCKIYGRSSRYRGEPQRELLPTTVTAA
jgi:P-aminobenzoate N-oxygenase AurF